MARKRPSQSASVVPRKEARAAEGRLPHSSDGETPVWQIARLRTNGRWAWALSVDELDQVRQKLAVYETMTWREIKRNDSSGSHSVEVERLSRDAQAELERLREDTDELFSLRITATARVWGVKLERVLRILWWDPNHEVCPSTMRHT